MAGNNPTLQQYAGSYHLDYVRIADPSDTPIDITGLVGEINVDSSILDPTITVRIMVVDARNALANLPIKGGGFVSVQFSFADSFLKYDLRIAEVSSLSNFEQQRAYQIVCISPTAFNCSYQRISQSFTGTVSEIANAIFSQYGVDPVGIWENSTGQQTLVIPQWSPIKSIMWLADRAKPDDDNIKFRFFQNSFGRYNFTPIEHSIALYKQMPVATYTYFKNVTRNVTVNGDERPNTAADMFSIQDVKYGQGGRVFNITEAFKRNMLAGKMTSTDLFTGTYKEQYYDFFSQFDQAKYANPQPQYRAADYYPGNILFKTISNYSTPNGEQYNENDDISDLKRSTINDYTQRLEITVKGNNIIDIGQIIKVQVPSPEPHVTGKEGRDLYWSGLYFIVGKRDKYDRSEKVSVLELVKESLIGGALV